MKVKVNFSLCMLGEWRSSSTFLTSALDGGEWSPSRPGYYTQEESTPLPTEDTAGRAPEQVWKF
jgi:hypothetical protein